MAALVAIRSTPRIEAPADDADNARMEATE